MKVLIASDIHGSAYYCRKVLEAFHSSGADLLLLLGDILYHGPRNDLPKEYRPKEVTELLNQHAEHILCVRGNCEAEVDQMVLDFPVLAEYALLHVDGVTLFATHGHVYHEQNQPKLASGSILLNGHTHVPAWREHEGYIYANPGSTSIPKEDSPHSYVMFADGAFTWYDLDNGKEYMKHEL